MLPFGLQPAHILIIAIVALIIFGPSRLPEIGRAIGKTIREFSSATKEAGQSFSDEVQKSDAKPAEAQPATTPCKSCGKPVQAGQKFCPECGAAQ